MVSNNQFLEIKNEPYSDAANKVVYSALNSATTIYCHLDSPIGTMLMTSQNEKLTGLYLEGQKYYPTIQTHWQYSSTLSLFTKAHKQLLEYLDGKRKQFDINYQLTKGTPLQKATWEKVNEIPYAQTVSYKDVASEIMQNKAVRTVASAIGRNPLMIIIPCHRVIMSDHSLSDYAAGKELKKFLISLEKND
jgi:methylated-DNA-[protein]-cysteine S-methyltransferase